MAVARSDFRDRAAAESLRLFAESGTPQPGSGLHPEFAAFSYCVRVGDGGDVLLRRSHWRAAQAAFAGFVLFVSGIACALTMMPDRPQQPGIWLAALIFGLMLGGVVTIIVGMMPSSHAVWRHLVRRVEGDPRFQGLTGVQIVGPRTFQGIALVEADRGLMYVDARGRILIEGVCFRYQIRTADVVSCRPVVMKFGRRAEVTGCTVEYVIGREVLTLTLEPHNQVDDLIEVLDPQSTHQSQASD